MTQINAAGLVEKWLTDERLDVIRWESDTGDDGPGSFTLDHLQAAFYMLILGYLLAGLILLSERLLYTAPSGSNYKNELIRTKDVYH